MNLIRERTEEVGPLDYIAYFCDNNVGSGRTNSWHYQNMHFTVSASSCRIDHHFHEARDGDVVVDQDIGLLLREIWEVKVAPREQLFAEAGAKAGHSEWTSRVDRPLFALVTEFAGNKRQYFLFSDESIANRVAQAIVHAIELCGVGGKDPFLESYEKQNSIRIRGDLMRIHPRTRRSTPRRRVQPGRGKVREAGIRR